MGVQQFSPNEDNNENNQENNNNSNNTNDNNTPKPPHFYDIYIGPFQISDQILGEGNFGKIYLGKHMQTKEEVAIKKMPRYKKQENGDNHDNITLIKSEIKIFKKLHHPYICKMFYTTFDTEENYYIITEKCEDFLRKRETTFNEVEACKIFSQILSAVEYMHKNFIIHRDIKPENILFDEYGDVKLIDFGLSAEFKESELFDDSPGSPQYSAPEVLLRNDNEKYVGYLTDIWSLGVCLYQFIYVNTPFVDEETNTVEKFKENMRNNELNFPAIEDDYKVSEEYIDLLKKILEKDPKKRLTIEQIKQHPWMSLINNNIMKSPGISIDKDIIPVDIEIIRELCSNIDAKMEELVKDIINNEYNNSTCYYYIKIQEKKRKNLKTISDLRPTSDLFLDYINSEKSKLSFYQNDINKALESIMNSIKEKINEESKTFIKIKSSIIDENKKNTDKKNEINDIVNDENKNNINIMNKKQNKKKLNTRSRSSGKFEINFSEEKQEEKKIKVNLNNHLFYARVNNIMFQPLNIIKTEHTLNIEIENSNNSKNSNSNNKTNEDNKIAYILNKTASLFYPKNKQKKSDKKFETINNSDNNNKNKIFNKNINNKNNKNSKNNNNKNLINSKYNHSSININHPTSKIKSLKIEKNKEIKNINDKNNKQYQKGKSGNIINTFKTKVSSAVTSLKSILNIGKKKINNNNKKINNKTKPLHRSFSFKAISKLNLIKLSNNDDEDINKISTKKRPNTFNKNYHKSKIPKNKEEKKAEKFINKKRVISTFNNNNLNVNLNINETINAKYKSRPILPKNKQTKLINNTNIKNNKNKNKLNLSMSSSVSQTSIRTTDKKKRINRSITQESNNINKGNKTTIVNSTNKKIDKKTKISPINKINNNGKRIQIKSKLFVNKPNEKKPDKKSTININNQTSRQKSKVYLESNRSTIDTSTRKKILNDNIKNIKITEYKNTISDNKKIRNVSVDTSKIKKKKEKTNHNSKNNSNIDMGENKYEIKIKKEKNLVKDIILSYLGENNTTVSISKSDIKFNNTKIYVGKKKVEFNLILLENGKNKSTIKGKLIEGDVKIFEEAFVKIKDILK